MKCTCKKGVAKKCSYCKPRKATGIRDLKEKLGKRKKLRKTRPTGMRSISKRL